MVEEFSPTQQKALEALATYRYLTKKQMLRLGVAKDKSHLNKAIGGLEIRSKEILKRFRYSFTPGHAKPSDIYVLTEYGAELASEAMREDVTPIKNPRKFSNDYKHRVRSVDFHIAVRQWAARNEASIDFFDAYYDPQRKRNSKARGPATRLIFQSGILDADAIFSITDRVGVQRLFAFELYNNLKTDWVSKKLLPYVRALDDEVFLRQYSYGGAARILVVFHDPKGMELVSKRIIERNMIERRSQHFFVQTLDAAQVEFVKGWRRFGGKEVVLF